MTVWRREEYPENWAEMSKACRDRASWRCEHCQIAHGDTRISKLGVVYPVWLAACHVHGYAKSDRNAKLLCLCFTCHAKYDAPYRNAKRALEHEIVVHHLLLAAI